ncbi:hypothetical protein CN330_12155 [Priestia megaterium]|uniref:hypothetical protein n=1 Tax=Priestia megaterium TaxID=1404 RepID=UPI000BF341FF|nr:hypothetical protein [Priestia megaterium]PEZ12876.1 hypothetical protein CN330_12155 [Priestia megaterium]
MLLNAKAEELSKYSKLKYEADKFIQKVKELWDYSDLQIRSVYLISDLAKKGNGVFSIAYSTFQTMFEQRFKMKISLSSVRRFFTLMSKLGLVSVHKAKRKNEQQSANIYIIEQQCEEPTQVEEKEHPVEQAPEHQNSISKEIQDGEQKPLSKECVNSKEVQQEEIIHNAYIKFKKHINKTLFCKILTEIKNKKEIRNFQAYLEGALSKVENHIRCNNGTLVFEHHGLSDFYGVLMGQ